MQVLLNQVCFYLPPQQQKKKGKSTKIVIMKMRTYNLSDVISYASASVFFATYIWTHVVNQLLQPASQTLTTYKH